MAAHGRLLLPKESPPGFSRVAELGPGQFGVVFLERRDGDGKLFALKYLQRPVPVRALAPDTRSLQRPSARCRAAPVAGALPRGLRWGKHAAVDVTSGAAASHDALARARHGGAPRAGVLGLARHLGVTLQAQT